MSKLPHRYRMVIALDDSEYAEIVLEHALDQAAQRDTVDLHVLTVVEREADVDATKERLTRSVFEMLDAFRAGATRWRTRLHVRVGAGADEIALLAEEVDAHLIVMGRFGVHHPRRSFAEAILARTRRPVLVVGLSGSEPETQPQCPDCMQVREESEGARWFCTAHVAPDRLRLSTLVPAAVRLTGGGPLW
ncbi:MAG: universal stress protein [Kofleriaceae bacterium]|nr:universal stress protein [Kofleriaceae bacterium]